MLFESRSDAGKKLAEKLKSYSGKQHVVAIGLARGGIVVAAEIAKVLDVALDAIIVKKIGAPDNEELALGAVSEVGEGVFNDELISLLGVSKEYLWKEAERQREIVRERKKRYFKGKQSPTLEGTVVILIDDGIATGASMKVAIEAIRSNLPDKIVLAVPVAPSETIKEFELLVDEVVCLHMPKSFGAVGAFYRQFSQFTEGEIVSLIHKK